MTMPKVNYKLQVSKCTMVYIICNIILWFNQHMFLLLCTCIFSSMAGFNVLYVHCFQLWIEQRYKPIENWLKDLHWWLLRRRKYLLEWGWISDSLITAVQRLSKSSHLLLWSAINNQLWLGEDLYNECNSSHVLTTISFSHLEL